MLDKDPNHRPTAVEILQDPFVKGHMEVSKGHHIWVPEP